MGPMSDPNALPTPPSAPSPPPGRARPWALAAIVLAGGFLVWRFLLPLLGGGAC